MVIAYLLRKMNFERDRDKEYMVKAAMFYKLGCQVTQAANGPEGLACVQQHTFDFILMDCMMPMMDGYAATQAIRALEVEQNRLHTPIIACTAHQEKGHDEKCFAAGMDAFINKPLRQEDVERVLTQWLPKEKQVAAG